MTPHLPALTRRERHIMDILFRLGRATADDVMRGMPGDPSSSTVRTQLRVLEEKGHVRHEEHGRRYVYMPSVPRAAARKSALQHVVHTFFDGSVEKVVAALLGSDGGRLSDDELGRIAELVSKAKKDGDTMSLLLEATIKVSVILGAALAVMPLLRDRSASMRHQVLSAALVCAVLAPLARTALPGWELPIHLPLAPVTASEGGQFFPPAMVATGSGPTAAVPLDRFPAAAVVMWLWLAGLLLSGAVLLRGLVALARLVTNAQPVTSAVWITEAEEVRTAYGLAAPVRLLHHRDPHLLIVWGATRARVLVPTRALAWDRNRVRMVLRHELAHVRRGDWIVQCAAEFLAAVYWFNPLAWRLCARLRQESEQACDDAVLNGGVDGPEYAAHLVDIARHLQPRQAILPAHAIAHPSGFERRITAMLDTHINRRPMSRKASLATLIACLLIALPIAALAAAQGVARVGGAIVDPQYGILPGVEMVLTNVDTQATHAVRTDRNGRYEVSGLPPGRYTFETRLPGFQSVRGELTVQGQDVERDLTLEIGTLQETITITSEGSLGDAEKPPARQTRRPERAPNTCPSVPARSSPFIGGNIRTPRKLVDKRPVYPAHLESAGVAGAVVLQARIGLDGNIRDLSVLSATHPDFAAATADAVRQWEFDTTLLNCVPVEVTMNVNARFQQRQ